VKEAIEIHRAKMEEFKKFLHQATVFEFPQLLDEAGRILNRIGSNLRFAIDLWDFIDSFEDYMSNIRSQPWASVDLDAVEVQSHAFNDAVFAMPASIRFSHAFTTIQAAVKELLATCPLMASLQSENMRERHWDQMGAKLDKVVPNPLRQQREAREKELSGIEVTEQPLKLSTILSLGLHEHVEAVEELMEAAMKENKMEASLDRMRVYWDALEFQVNEY